MIFRENELKNRKKPTHIIVEEIHIDVRMLRNRILGVIFPKKVVENGQQNPFIEIRLNPETIRLSINRFFWPFFGDFFGEITSESDSSEFFTSIYMSPKFFGGDFKPI